MEINREDLEIQAKELGIKFNSRIGDDKLQAKVDAVLNGEVEVEDTEPKVVIKDSTNINDGYDLDLEVTRTNNRIKRPTTKLDKRREIIQRGLKRSKVIVYNNDPKEREMSTTYSAVRNSFFGDARVIPIGKEWWLQQIHIDNLKSIEIPAMAKDREGNVIPNGRMTKKFTIDILETDEEAAKARLAKQAKS